jgi:hypothetical protein
MRTKISNGVNLFIRVIGIGALTLTGAIIALAMFMPATPHTAVAAQAVATAPAQPPAAEEDPAPVDEAAPADPGMQSASTSKSCHTPYQTQDRYVPQHTVKATAKHSEYTVSGYTNYAHTVPTPKGCGHA